MKAPTQTQVTIGLAIVGLVLLYYGINKASNAVGGIGKGIGKVWDTASAVVTDVVIAPAQAVGHAVGSVINADYSGEAAQVRYEPQDLVLQGLTGRKYANPMVNNDGYDFSQLSG